MTEEKLIKNTDNIIEIEGYKIYTYDIEYLERIKGLYGFIYVTTNLVNGKMYVGQKKKIQGWKTYLGSGMVFMRAVKYHGRKNFNRKIIDIAFDSEELNQLEHYYSKLFDVIDRDNWYNLCYGGKAPNGHKRHHSEETRQKISKTKLDQHISLKWAEHQYESHKKYYRFHPHANSKSVIRYGVDGIFEKIYTSALRAAKELNGTRGVILSCCHGECKTAYGYQWRFMPEDGKYKQKIEALVNCRPYKPRNYTKSGDTCITSQGIKVNQYTNDNIYIATFNSYAEAQRETGVDAASVRRCCNKQQKTASGFKWFCVEDCEQPDKTKIILEEE